MKRAFSLWLRLALLGTLGLSLGLSVGCGDGGENENENENGENEDENGENGKEFVADTSDYDGLIAWSKVAAFGVYVWDLPKSELVYSHEPQEETTLTLIGQPTLSRDGSTFAYAHGETIGLGGLLLGVSLRDMASGDLIAYPVDDLREDQQRITSQPSLSRDGKIVAVLEQQFDWVESEIGLLPDNETDEIIEVWNRETGERTQITDGTHIDIQPHLAADGSRVLFLSNRGGGKYDFYIADVEENPAVERLTDLGNEPEARGYSSETASPNHIAVSDDLRYVAFIGRGPHLGEPDNLEKSATAFFLLDTSTKTLERLDVMPHGITVHEQSLLDMRSVALSGDGSTIAYHLHFTSFDIDRIGSSTQVLIADRATPSNTRLIEESGEGDIDSALDTAGLALSADGSQIAYSFRGSELWIRGSDGSNPAQIVAKEQKRVAHGLAMDLSF